MMNKIVITALLLILPLSAKADVVKKDDATDIGSKTERGLTGFEADPDFNLQSVQELWNRKDLSKKTVKSYDYDPLVTIPVQMRQNLHSLIVLPSWEEAEVVTLGDEVGFNYARFKDSIDRKNMLVLNGIYAGSDTDMRIIGRSGRVYNFYLRNDPVDSFNPPHLTIYINADMPNDVAKRIMDEKAEEQEKKSRKGYINPLTEGTMSELKKARADYLRFLPEASEINMEYSVRGSKDIAPKAVFDDAEGFTYFDYRETAPSTRLPVVYQLINDFESLVNTEFKEGFLIAKVISNEGFTLRNGDSYVCIKPE